MVEYKKAKSIYSFLIPTAVIFCLLTLSISTVFFYFSVSPRLGLVKEILSSWAIERERHIHHMVYILNRNIHFTANEMKFRIDLMSKNFPIVSVFKRECFIIESKIEEFFTHVNGYDIKGYFESLQKWYKLIRDFRKEKFFKGVGNRLGDG